MRLVLQFNANLLGSRKSAKNHRFCADGIFIFGLNFYFVRSYDTYNHHAYIYKLDLVESMLAYFLFLSCILARIIKHLIDNSVSTAQIGLSSLVGDIDEFLPSKISVSKYTAKIKIPTAQKPGAY